MPRPKKPEAAAAEILARPRMTADEFEIECARTAEYFTAVRFRAGRDPYERHEFESFSGAYDKAALMGGRGMVYAVTASGRSMLLCTPGTPPKPAR